MVQIQREFDSRLGCKVSPVDDFPRRRGLLSVDPHIAMAKSYCGSSLLSSDLLVSLLTPPVLLGILGGRAAGLMMDALGNASEELFRGDRLPILTVSPQKNQASE